MTNTVKMELAAANRQLASDSPQDSPVPDKQTVSQRKEKRLKWRTTVEDKSSMFSSAWNELYNVLGEYKAVLLKRDEIEEHYDETSDVDRLRNELLEKDQVIFEKENEIQTVRDQASEYRRKFEQSQLEVSVKESLLKKYQGEILQKEQLLLEARTKTTRLESKIRLLETPVSNSGLSEPPRKIVRVTQPAATPVGTPVRAAPTTPVGGPVRAAATPTRGGRQVATRGRSPMSTRRTQREPTPEVVETPPICLDDDDDDVVVEQQPNQNQNASLQDDSSASNMATLENEGGDTVYMEVWPEEGTESGTPGTSQDQSQEFVEEHEGLEQWTGDMTGMVADQGGTEQQAGSQGNKRPRTRRITKLTRSKSSVKPPLTVSPAVEPRLKKKTPFLACAKCDEKFHDLDAMELHAQEAHPKYLYGCGICQINFRTEDALMSHAETHESQEPILVLNRIDDDKSRYFCPVCQQEFGTKEESNEHARNHSDDDTYLGRTAARMATETKDTEVGDLLECQQCGVILKGLTALAMHVEEMHEEILETTTENIVPETPQNRIVRSSPRSSSKRPPPNGKSCAVCGKEFSSRQNMNRHFESVHKLSQHECDVCESKFTRSDDLARHRIRHKPLEERTEEEKKRLIGSPRVREKVEDQTYPCPHCEKTFTIQNNRDRHIRSVHERTNQLECKYCQKVHCRVDELKKHEKRHEDNSYGWLCHVCNLSFLAKKTLYRHVQQNHPGEEHKIVAKKGDEKAHTCEQCGESFSASSSLIRHRASAHSAPAFSCQVCGKQFKRKDYLRNHERDFHNRQTDELVDLENIQYSCFNCQALFATEDQFNQHVCIVTEGEEGELQAANVHVEESPDGQRIILLSNFLGNLQPKKAE